MSVLLALGGLFVFIVAFQRGGNALGVAMERGGWVWLRFPVALGGGRFAAIVLGLWVAQYAP